MLNLEISTIRKICIAAIVMVYVTAKVSGQYNISGNNCVLPGPYTFTPYQITGNLGANAGAGDVWKITNGTINGNTTYTNPGNSYCGGIAWGSGATIGTLAYYRPGTATTPVATINVNIINPGTISPSYTAYPAGFLLNMQLMGTDATSCGVGNPGVMYQWQKQVSGVFSNIPNATQRDYKITNESFTQQTLFWRITTYQGQSSYNNNGPVIIDPKIAPIVGGVSPLIQTIQPTQPPGTLTSAASSGGAFPGSFGYYWQASQYNLDWADIVPAATGLVYTPPLLAQTMFYRLRVASGPVQAGIYSNVVTIKVLSPLTGGLLTPAVQTIPYNTAPAIIIGTPTTSGLCEGTYNYEWESSADGASFFKISTAPNSESYTPDLITSTTYFRRKVKLSCNSEVQNSNIVVVKVPNPTDNVNSIKEKVFKRGGITEFTVDDYLSNPAEVTQSTTYFDGLGRDIQTVIRKGSIVTDKINPASSANASDVIGIKEYDNLGREPLRYLSFADADNSGIYRADAKTRQNNILLQQYGWQGESIFYGKTNFDASPLNRIQKSMAPGNSWTGSDRGIETKYWINTVIDDVKMWSVTNVLNNWGVYTVTGQYLPGQLYKIVTIDEHGKQVIEFKDKDEKVILKKSQISIEAGTEDDGTGRGYDGWLCTFYIYDDLGQLRCVVQPEGVKLLALNEWDITALDNVILHEQCFRYEYDQLKRMTTKKLPGAGEVWMVYDERDRLVMTQDANLRAASVQQWFVTVFENSLNRPVRTFLITDPFNYNNAEFHRAMAAGSITYPVVANFTNELLSETHYDDYTGLPVGLYSTLYNNSYGPYLTASSSAPDYADPIVQSFALKGLITWTSVKVLGTASQFLSTVNIYDEKGRVIQTQMLNITNGLDVVTNQYSFSDQVLRSHTKHQKLGGTGTQSYEVATRNNYDALGRIISMDKNLNNIGWKTISSFAYDASGKLAKKKIGVKPNTNTTPITSLATLDYEYNTRGWLLSINKSYIGKPMYTSNTDQYFGMQLGYDKNGSFGTFLPKYNGNIAGTIWKSEGDQEKRKYDFTYDAVNRLTAAGFTQYVSGKGTTALFNTKSGINFSVENISYDGNGNILTMWQKGLKLNSSDYIDKLTYNYTSNSNKLLNVIDAVNDPGTKLGDFRTSGLYQTYTPIKTESTIDYNYDANGNLVNDRNKDILGINRVPVNGILYNHLNLPNSISVLKSGGGTATSIKGYIKYTYDAAGNKLKKVAVENASVANNNIATTTTTTYIGGFVYETKTDNNPLTIDYTDVLQFIGQEDGRIRALHTDASNQNTNTGFVNDYFIKDHLGNIRMVLTDGLQSDIYTTLSFEGAANSTDVNNQNAIWEKADGTAFDVVGKRTNVQQLVNATGLVPSTLANSLLVRSSTGKIGAAKLFKVMSGDKVHTTVQYYFSQNTENGSTTSLNTLIAGLASVLLNSSGSLPVLKSNPAALASSVSNDPNIIEFFNPQNGTTNNGSPKAFLNVLFFDEQFKFDNFSSYSEQIGTSNPGQIVIALGSAKQARKNGYCYIYISNETNDMVYFDNFTLLHERGPILEETHYYPFGLTMSGISSKAAGKPEANKRFQGQDFAHKEFSDGSGLEMYEFKWRMDDPQIGRFWQIDPLASKYVYNSTYAFSENKVTGHVELEGLESVAIDLINTVIGWGVNLTNGRDNLVAGANQSAASRYGGDNNLPRPIQDIKAVQGNLQMNAGVLEMNKPALDVIVTVGGTVAGMELPASLSLVTGSSLGESQTVFRVFGGDAIAEGYSWTPVKPTTVSNFRDVAGLPSGGASGKINTATQMVEGTVKRGNIIVERSALPLDGNKGGLPEFIINPLHIHVKKITPITPKL